MAVKQTKTLAAQTTTTTVASGEKFPKVNAQNQTTLITLENLRAAILAGNDLNALEDGIFIMRVLVVAPTEAANALYWGSANVAGGGVTTSDRVTAYSDWAGKTNTAAQVTHSELSGAAYAPGFCNQYSRTNANGYGLTAGKWWLPSLGEMMMIYANMTKINYALSLIEGATLLQETAYWTSTEYSATYAWVLTLGNGGMGNHAKASYTYRVRPVSAFIS